jgi:hypothetical protein
MGYVTNIVMNKIVSGIENHANLNGLSKYDLYVKIAPGDEDFKPVYTLCNRTKEIKDISFADFVGINSFMGFDVAGKGESYIQKFLVMCAADNSLDCYDDHFYFIRINTTDKLQAYMYVDKEPKKEISIDYILSTK